MSNLKHLGIFSTIVNYLSKTQSLIAPGSDPAFRDVAAEESAGLPIAGVACIRSDVLRRGHHVWPEVRMRRPIRFPTVKGLASQQQIHRLGQPLLYHGPPSPLTATGKNHPPYLKPSLSASSRRMTPSIVMNSAAIIFLIILTLSMRTRLLTEVATSKFNAHLLVECRCPSPALSEVWVRCSFVSLIARDSGPIPSATDEHVKQVEDNLNNRPRKSLGYKSPNEVYFKELEQLTRVALTA